MGNDGISSFMSFQLLPCCCCFWFPLRALMCNFTSVCQKCNDRCQSYSYRRFLWLNKPGHAGTPHISRAQSSL